MRTKAKYTDFVESMVITEGDGRIYENTLGLVGEAREVLEEIFGDLLYDLDDIEVKTLEVENK